MYRNWFLLIILQIDSDENNEGVNNVDGAESTQNKKKAKKRVNNRQKCTIESDDKKLFASFKEVEVVTFNTQEDIDVSATDNLFSMKQFINPSTHLPVVL